MAAVAAQRRLWRTACRAVPAGVHSRRFVSTHTHTHRNIKAWGRGDTCAMELEGVSIKGDRVKRADDFDALLPDISRDYQPQPTREFHRIGRQYRDHDGEVCVQASAHLFALLRS